MDISPEETITTSPCTTIQDYVEISRIPAFRLNLLDMLKNFDINDVSIFEQDDREAAHEFGPYITSIRDLSENTFIVNRDIIWAKRLMEGDKKAQFILTIYRGKKALVTIQEIETGLYLSCIPNDSGHLQLLPLGEKTPNFTDPETFNLFFYIKNSGNRLYSFESFTNLGLFLCTHKDRVTIQRGTEENNFRMDFKFDPEYHIVIPNRLKYVLSRTQKANITDKWNNLLNNKIFHERSESILTREDFTMPVNALTSTPESSYTTSRQGILC